MIKAVIRAPLLSISGYGVHSRQIFSYLENRMIRWKIQRRPFLANVQKLIITPFNSTINSTINSIDLTAHLTAQLTAQLTAFNSI